MKASIAIVVPEITNRLSFTLDWLFVEQLGVSYKLFTEIPADKDFQLIIGYGKQGTNFSIPAEYLLLEKNIITQKIESGIWNELPVLFFNGSKDATIPFDIFSALFYLISRYEEYLAYTPDKHNRYPATESILFRHQILDRPIVDEWIFEFANELEKQGIETRENKIKFIPTYDIDIAWKHKNKGMKRSIGGYFKSFIYFNFDEIVERSQILLGTKKDAFDSFDTIFDLGENVKSEPLIFILAAKKNSAFDKNILPINQNMQSLIAKLSSKFEVGIHPSYRSNEEQSLFSEEKNTIEKITNKQINISRQHYIKLEIPHSYRQLISIGIKEDYSMGYGTQLGFRAGTSNPFLWYDLEKEETTSLKIFPFCFMDTTAHYELRLEAMEAFERLNKMKRRIEKTGGTLITIFHNFSLGSAKEWKDWQEQYTAFYKKNSD